MELWWNGTGLAVLGFEKKGGHEHAGKLKKAVKCPRNCVLCDKVVVAYDWKMLNNVKLIPLSWKGSSMENVMDGIEMEIKIPTVSSLKNEKLFEWKCNEITGWNCWHARDTFMWNSK